MVFSVQTLLAAIYTAAIITVSATPTTPSTPHIVTLDQGTFTGTTSDSVVKFLGIPFAQPPVGDLRFRLPQALGPYSGIHDATGFGTACPQQVLGQRGFETPSCSGACQFLHGGGFAIGSSSPFDGGVIVDRSIALNEPVVYVSLNYRIAAFGFLASQEVKDAGVGNLGLQDQRMALRWIQQYIHAFGGDPSKVTIWGQSSGAISVSLQMLTNGGDTEGLFHAAFMESGFPTPIGDITHGQPFYDDLVQRTGCSGSPDTLACLRAVPYETLKTAMNTSPVIAKFEKLSLVWQTRADGVFLPDDPQNLVQQGKVANIPFITGDCDDEGTLLSLVLTTDPDLLDFLSGFFFAEATKAEQDKLLALYPQDDTQGSPYDTGTQNAFTPQYKRVASVLGDLAFQAPRRFLLKNVSDKQNTWSYLSKRLKSLPLLGSAHASDLRNIYGPGDLTDFLIHFATNLDPNGGSSPQWPKYTTSSPQVMTFLENQATNTTITLDDYRVDGMEFLTEFSLANPL